jgi:hypothetical protein
MKSFVVEVILIALALMSIASFLVGWMLEILEINESKALFSAVRWKLRHEMRVSLPKRTQGVGARKSLVAKREGKVPLFAADIWPWPRRWFVCFQALCSLPVTADDGRQKDHTCSQVHQVTGTLICCQKMTNIEMATHCDYNAQSTQQSWLARREVGGNDRIWERTGGVVSQSSTSKDQGFSGECSSA